jgi:hypothetical protein
LSAGSSKHQKKCKGFKGITSDGHAEIEYRILGKNIFLTDPGLKQTTSLVCKVFGTIELWLIGLFNDYTRLRLMARCRDEELRGWIELVSKLLLV